MHNIKNDQTYFKNLVSPFFNILQQTVQLKIVYEKFGNIANPFLTNVSRTKSA